jgi:hypothetical protein
VDYQLRLDYSDFRRYCLGIGAMVLLLLLVRFAVVRHNPGAVHLLFSTLLVRAVQAGLLGCDNCARPDIIHLSTEVRTTHYLLRFPCPDRSALTCTITYESLYEIPRPYCLEDKVIAMTSLSGLFRTSLVMSLFSYLGCRC